MIDDEFRPQSPRSRRRLIERLDHMVAAGQITEGEATQLRTARSEREFDAAVVAIRSRHAGARLDEAVQSGHMTRAEADANLERLRNGEHPRGLRAHLHKITSRSDGSPR
jgi:hypothetical protein